MNEKINEVDQTDSGSGTELPRARDYEVGYCKPPRQSQFKKGQSGNRNGRPKESTSLTIYFEEMLDEHDISAKSGGRVMSKKEAIMRALFKRAASCNQRAFKRFMRLSEQAGLLKRPASACDTSRSARAGIADMQKFKAEFGKPLPDSHKQ